MTHEIELARGIDRTAETREGFRTAMTIAYDAGCGLLVPAPPDADGVVEIRRVRVRVELLEDDRTLKQNAFYWAVVLPSISDQVAIDGTKWAAEAWHELAKRTHLGYKVERVALAGRKRKSVRRTLRSTTKLSVRAMSTYLDKVIAWAITDFGVAFPLADWRLYQEAIERDRREIVR